MKKDEILKRRWIKTCLLRYLCKVVGMLGTWILFLLKYLKSFKCEIVLNFYLFILYFL